MEWICSTTPEFWLEAIQAGAVCFGVYVAWRGLRTWRSEVIGRRRIEIAEEALSAFHEAAKVIRWARSPFSYEGEGSSRPREANESNSKTKDSYYVPVERLRKRQTVFDTLEMVMPKAIIHFEGAADPFNEIQDICINIEQSSFNLIQTADREIDWNNDPYRKWYTTIRSTDNENAVTSQLETAVSQIDEILKPHLGVSPAGWWRWLIQSWKRLKLSS